MGTKPLLHVTGSKLRDEVASLAYLSLRTNRTMIVPNVFLGHSKKLDRTKFCPKPKGDKDSKSFYCKYAENGMIDVSHAAYQDDGYYWPSFRAISSVSQGIDLVEPGYYYKMENDLGMTVPDAEVIMYQGVSGWRGKYKLDELAKTVEGYTADRLVLGLVGDEGSSFSKDWYQAWAKSGSSSWGTMKIDLS